MKLTNRKNLPQIIVDAVANDPYNAGEKTDYSCTTLLKPGYQVKLQKDHKDDIVEDVADRLWAMYGSAAHHVVERGASESDEVETRYYADIDGIIISAQIDHLRDKILSDWKLTGAYKVKLALQGSHDEWTQQLNIQAYLLKQAGVEVEKLFIGAFVRDWMKSKFKFESGYPDQIEYIELPLWTEQQQLTFIKSRIAAMQAAVPCTQAERWQDDPSFALMKKGAKRAAKVEKTRAAIEQYAIDKKYAYRCAETNALVSDEYSIDERIPPNRRCEFYCNVAEFCDYYKANYADADELPLK